MTHTMGLDGFCSMGCSCRSNGGSASRAELPLLLVQAPSTTCTCRGKLRGLRNGWGVSFMSGKAIRLCLCDREVAMTHRDPV